MCSVDSHNFISHLLLPTLMLPSWFNLSPWLALTCVLSSCISRLHLYSDYNIQKEINHLPFTLPFVSYISRSPILSNYNIQKEIPFTLSFVLTFMPVLSDYSVREGSSTLHLVLHLTCLKVTLSDYNIQSNPEGIHASPCPSSHASQVHAYTLQLQHPINHQSSRRDLIYPSPCPSSHMSQGHALRLQHPEGISPSPCPSSHASQVTPTMISRRNQSICIVQILL